MALKKDIAFEILDHIDKATDGIREEVSEVRKEIVQVNITTTRQQSILEEHIKRTELNEKTIDTVHNRLLPIEKHVAMFSGVAKLVMLLAGITGIASLVLRLLGKI